MKKIVAIVCLVLCTVAVHAQTPSSGAAPVDPLKMGKKLTDHLVAAIDASAFLNSWTAQARASWNSKLANASDASTLAKCVSELSEYIKPGKFKPQFSLAQFKSLAANTNNYGDVANAMTQLEAGLADEAYNTEWVSEEASWQGELKLVK